MRSIKPALVEVVLRRIDDIAHRDWAKLYWRDAAMPQCGRRVHLVMVGEKWNHLSPSTFAGHPETVQQYEADWPDAIREVWHNPQARGGGPTKWWPPQTAAIHTHQMAIEPFNDTALTDNDGNALPQTTVDLAVVPAGKLLVVEQISGRLAVRDGDVVDAIQAAATGADSVAFLPVQLVSSLSQFSAAQGHGRWHQFGSPVRLYVRAGQRIVVSGLANATFGLFAAAIGHLVDA